jgi:hypothetical protein
MRIEIDTGERKERGLTSKTKATAKRHTDAIVNDDDNSNSQLKENVSICDPGIP